MAAPGGKSHDSDSGERMADVLGCGECRAFPDAPDSYKRDGHFDSCEQCGRVVFVPVGADGDGPPAGFPSNPSAEWSFYAWGPFVEDLDRVVALVGGIRYEVLEVGGMAFVRGVA